MPVRCRALDRPRTRLARATGILAGRAVGTLTLVGFRLAHGTVLLILGSTRATGPEIRDTGRSALLMRRS